MPRLKDEFLECVIYFYRSEHEAKEGINIGGSGFLVSIPAPEIPGNKSFLYAVTNRHVLAAGAHFLRWNQANSGIFVVETKNNDWVSSETDDLAVTPIDPTGWDTLAHKAIGLDSILSEKIAKEIEFGVGDEVFMVGRFINAEGKQRNQPTVRFGNIAQMLGEPLHCRIDSKTIIDQYSILAEIRSIGGYSGSPVMLNELPFIDRLKTGKTIDKHWLVGIDWGHVPMWSPVCGFNEEPIGNGWQVETNTGMAAIVPAWKLRDLLMTKVLADARAAAIAKVLPAKQKPLNSPSE